MGNEIIQTEAWRQVILNFESRQEYGNPFQDISIMAEFAGPSGRVIKREAYWDGANIYKVAFAPVETGRWNWVLTAPEESGLNEVRGELECISYEGELAIYRHGFLKVDSSGRYLTYQDGTPFFWLGDTHWGFAFAERYEESNHPDMDSMFCGMAERRREQGFNVYQTNLRSDIGFNRDNQRYWAGETPGLIPNVQFYQQELDRRMNYLADLGFVNALGLAWGMSIIGQIPLQKSLARYITARYGALPIVWTLAGEVAGYAGGENRKQSIDGWKEVALYLQEIDGYGNLQTAHYTNERPFADYYQLEDWFDFTLNQAGHGDFPISARYYREFRNKYPSKPFIEGESLYEFCSTLEENGSRLCTADMLRRVAYMSIQEGGCGYTYGAQGIWDTVWEKPEKPGFGNIFNAFGIAWYEAIDGVGGTQMGYMRKFYEDVKFYELSPVRVSSSGTAFAIDLGLDMFVPLVTANPGMSRIVIYYGAASRGGCRIEGLEDLEYAARWFDPRTGEYTNVAELVKPEGGIWESPVRNSAGDWLLVVEKR